VADRQVEGPLSTKKEVPLNYSGEGGKRKGERGEMAQMNLKPRRRLAGSRTNFLARNPRTKTVRTEMPKGLKKKKDNFDRLTGKGTFGKTGAPSLCLWLGI